MTAQLMTSPSNGLIKSRISPGSNPALILWNEKSRVITSPNSALLRAATRLSRLSRAKPRSSSSIKLPTFRLMDQEFRLSELPKDTTQAIELVVPLRVRNAASNCGILLAPRVSAEVRFLVVSLRQGNRDLSDLWSSLVHFVNPRFNTQKLGSGGEFCG